MSFTCTAHTSTEAYDDSTLTSGSTTQFDRKALDNARRRRRHSSYQPSAWAVDRENVQEVVDRFVADLGRRLEIMENYGHLKFDEGMTFAYDTLRAVHEGCTQVGDDILDAGRRRAKVLVETIDSHYRGALARKESLEQRVHEGVKLCEKIMSDFESKAFSMRRSSISAAAHEIMDSGKAYMDRTSVRAAEIVSEGADKARRAKEKLKVKIEDAIQRAKQHGLLNYEHLPEPWRVNPHILTGYRFSETKLDCVRSCFSISNESFNIWSHFIGLCVVLAMAFYIYPSSPAFASATGFDIFIAGCFFFAACKCLACSTIWHTMCSISDQTLMERFACVDYTGISFLVAASIMTTEYTAFYCEPISRWAYLSMTMIFGIAGTILPWRPAFNRADMSWARVGFFVSLACTGFLPVIQLTWQRGWEETAYFYRPIVMSLLVYITGACMYAAKIPERFLPGWFDLAGHSHNIWHMAVLGGIFFHYTAMQSFFGDAFRRAALDGQCSVY